MRFLRRLLGAPQTSAVLLLTALVSACTTGRAPPPEKPGESAGLPEGGIYKVGTPYQVEGVWYYPSEDYSYVEEGIASWYGPDFHGKRTANGERYDMNAMTAAHPTLPMPSVVNVTNLENGRSVKLRINDRGPFKSRRIIDVSRRASQLLGFQENGTARVRVQIDTQESLTIKNQFLAKNPGDMPQIAAAPRAAISASPLAPMSVSDLPAPKSAAGGRTPPKTAGKAPPKVATSTVPDLAQTPQQAIPGKARIDLPAGTGVYIQAGAFVDPANAHRLEQQLREFGNVFVLTTTVDGKQLYRVRLGPLQDNTGAEDLLKQVRDYGYDDAQIVRF
ncbi:MAG: septal ring lytic transglycosylase RlpA family protein [Rhodospirillaceae bacterium]|nr:septal ring lytic transglycosylase RlpA family protein [Rhodospirillaceae bacterium]